MTQAFIPKEQVYEKIDTNHVKFHHVTPTKEHNHLGLPWGYIYDIDGNIVTVEDHARRMIKVMPTTYAMGQSDDF